MSSHNNSNISSKFVLFSIDLKVSGEIITLNVEENDSVDILFKKHDSLRNQKNQLKLDKIKRKFIESIQKQIQFQSRQGNYELVRKLQIFIQNSSTKNHEKKDQQTPFKRILVQTNLKNQQINTQKNLQQKLIVKNSQHFECLNRYYKNSHFKQENQRQFEKNQMLMQQIVCKQKKVNKKIPKKIDDDLLKAYETIMKKSKDKSMRQMAEETLKSMNLYTPPIQKQYFQRQRHNVREQQIRENRLKQRDHNRQKNINTIEQPKKGLIKNKGYDYSSLMNESLKFSNQNSLINQQEQKTDLKLRYKYVDNESKSQPNYNYSMNGSCYNLNKEYLYINNNDSSSYYCQRESTNLGKRKFKYLI